MISSIVAFLVMINPFALFLYLEPIRQDLKYRDFLKVLFKASMISLAVCVSFFFLGNFIFEKILQINFESFRIFGGIIIFSFAYHFIVKGNQAMILIKEDLDDLASEIALPFMVGAGTISLSVLLSHEMNALWGVLTLIIIFILNLIFILGLVTLRKSITAKKIKVAFDKNMGVLLRLNGFLIGAIGVDMILFGVKNLFGV